MASADAPVSIGNQGAPQRASLSAAGPGSVNPEFDPVREEPGRFKLQWIIPFPFIGCFSTEANHCASPDASIDATDSIAPVYTQPDALTLRPDNPGYLFWAWPLLPQLSFGEAEGLYQAQIGVVSTSLGNGTLVRRFTNSPNTSFRRPGGYFAFRTAVFEAEVLHGDLTAPGALIAARVAIQPLTLLYSSKVAKQPVEFDHKRIAAPYGRWQTGVTFATDLAAPVEVPLNFDAGVGPLDPLASQAPINALFAIGWENNLRILRHENGKILAYADVNVLSSAFGPRLGVGGHLGGLFLGNFGDLRLRVEVEVNASGPGYTPGYFDQMYMLERLKIVGHNETKLQSLPPASFGYLGRASVSYLPYASFFIEASDQSPLPAVGCLATPPGSKVYNDCANSARLSAGVSGSWLLWSGTASLSQSGVQNYLTDLAGGGLLALLEARMSLFFSYLQIFARGFITGNQTGITPVDPTFLNQLNAGFFLGLEINLSL